ncbi:hypothetical protein [Methyloglobulus sp.]|uniref:hypothetical protein n=1 Tax=Methyloglobulus sp. TaxID=2518622 RepID=UPI003988CD51
MSIKNRLNKLEAQARLRQPTQQDIDEAEWFAAHRRHVFEGAPLPDKPMPSSFDNKKLPIGHAKLLIEAIEKVRDGLTQQAG